MVALYADVQACYCPAKYGSRKIKSKRRNGGTQALREEAAKSDAGGPARTDRDIRFTIKVVA
jgi:hypothetical protein